MVQGKPSPLLNYRSTRIKQTLGNKDAAEEGRTTLRSAVKRSPARGGAGPLGSFLLGTGDGGNHHY